MIPSQNGSSVAPSVAILGSSMNSGQNRSIFVTAISSNGSDFATATPAHETLLMMPGQNGSSVAPSVTILGSSMNSGQNGSILVTTISNNGSDFATATPAHETPMIPSQNGSSVGSVSDNSWIINEFWSKRKYICNGDTR